MDIILSLTPESIALFHMGELIDLMKRSVARYGYKAWLKTLKENGGKESLSFQVLNGLPHNAIRYEKTENPFNRRWKRLKGRRKFRKGSTERVFPPVTDLKPLKTSLFAPGLKRDTAYITNGFQTFGSYATVHTLVAYNGRIGVIKSMEDVGVDLFELVIQVYLHEHLHRLSHIKVPEIFFLQKKTHSYRGKDDLLHQRVLVDVCMGRAKGDALGVIASYINSDIFVALAHVSKALWHLQRDFQFMHRDLSGTNVYYDKMTKNVTFIDFGMSCINPEKRQQAWQSDVQDFFVQNEDNHADHCSNRSLDTCILICHMSYSGHPWLREEHERMKLKMKEEIDSSENEKAKEKLRNTRTYTDITQKDWYPGNMLTPFNPKTNKGDGPHWWLYNMIEFPLEYWYPENLLTRLLRMMAFKHWFAIRKNWTDTFDSLMPKDVTVTINENYSNPAYVGKEGVVTRLHGRVMLKILVEAEEIIIAPKDVTVKLDEL